MISHQDDIATCACPACSGVSVPDDGGRTPEGAIGADLTGGATKPVWSLDQIVANLSRNNYKWNAAAPVPYDFLETSSDPQFSAFSDVQRKFTREAFNLIADIVPLTFFERPFSAVGSITFSNLTTLGSDIWGQASTGRSGSTINGSDIELSLEKVNERAWIFGGYNFQALMHEILHALGVPHPGVYNAGGGQTITYAANAQYFQDSRQYTIMSYFDPGSTGASYQTSGATGGIWSPATPMLHDIAVLQSLYGANKATRSGDTIYGYDSNAGRDVYDFDKLATPATTPSGTTVSPAPVMTLWDGGGRDTLNLSRAPGAVELDLREGAFSSTHGMKWNIAIAFGAVIENAVGGTGADTLIGNTSDNLLSGGDGADRMEGGAGADTLIGGAGVDTLIGGEGRDTAIFTGSFLVVDALYANENAGDAAGEVVESIEVFQGSSGTQVFRGTAAKEWFYGDAGDDHFKGRGGGDLFDGGAGRDTVWIDSHEGTLVIFDMGINSESTGEAAGASFVSIEALVGNDGTEIFRGTAAKEFFYGLTGDDHFKGRGGGDVIEGGDGRDTVWFDSHWGVRVVVDLKDASQNTGEAAGTSYLGIEAFVGNDGTDEFRGDDDAQTFEGLTGDDVLIGRGGADTLYGGSGADRFVFQAASDSAVGRADLIGDFDWRDGDLIDLSAIDADPNAAGDQAFGFVAAFTGKAGEAVLSSQAADRHTLRLDLNGDGQADVEVLIQGVIDPGRGWLL